ncbi:GntR family transcriptional regulator [Mesorhizobium sp.]|uniref:GntR family transcriptional regulator n=1 Tax=Mesorhizobium sp. TaxID=1871066 RepID=UPI000FE3BDF2|nr:GntR family transcriptional regulator [Mesorhizobium sp.]RWA97216.1 MAG: GntR family transcriptional regulator [Mesorhizobium sp.]RWK58386.1 MAG: GntR family transcriptional regulator [Mesorhizobium sp.]RWM42245.1 MAG: GntR family transcriptional regulator [Mesorhizobium sp.]RWM45225.1 MAG: GntR family transcriptional regulator [Mesorhizobium sp.]RWN50082.1 MAG: GntR family transcriptional regulator [Mesorhizobium sp.]
MATKGPKYEIPPLKASPSSTIEHVYAELKDALMSGEFSPGQPMRLKELAVAFGTSHMPIRESLNRLSGIDILERAPRQSARVPMITAEGLRDLLEVRLLNERQAIVWGVKKSAGKSLNYLREIKEKMELLNMEKNADVKKYLKLNQLFHFAVYNLSENKVLMNTIEAHWLQAGRVLGLRRKETRVVPGHHNHREIIDQLEKGNGLAAADALERDIMEAHEQIFAILEKSDLTDRAGNRVPA